MRSACGLLAILCAAPPAVADDSLRLRFDAERFHVDQPARSGLWTFEDSDRSALVLGDSTRAVADGTWWSNVDQPSSPALGVAARGWAAGLHVERDLGFAQLVVHSSVEDLETRFGRERRASFGITLQRTYVLSRWMTAWVSLGIGRTVWLGTPAPHDGDGTTAMLSIGTTFR